MMPCIFVQILFVCLILPFPSSALDSFFVHHLIRNKASCAPSDDKGRFIASRVVLTSTSRRIPAPPPRFCCWSFSPQARDSNRHKICSSFESLVNLPPDAVEAANLRPSAAARTLWSTTTHPPFTSVSVVVDGWRGRRGLIAIVGNYHSKLSLHSNLFRDWLFSCPSL